MKSFGNLLVNTQTCRTESRGSCYRAVVPKLTRKFFTRRFLGFIQAPTGSLTWWSGPQESAF